MDGVPQRREIATVQWIADEARFVDFGLSLEEGKEIHRRLQKDLTQFQTDQAARHDRKYPHCNCSRRVHDYRPRTIHSLFGSCTVRVPRWRSCKCGSTSKSSTGYVETLLDGRATPELERIQAELGSRLAFREAARGSIRPNKPCSTAEKLPVSKDGAEFFDAMQNARLVADAERYYRAT